MAGEEKSGYAACDVALASVMMALVFLYWTASIFIYGGALNAAMATPRTAATAAVAKS